MEKYSVDYLYHLQTRSKWKSNRTNIKIGDVCLIKDDNIIPSHWLLGKIVEVSMGNDSKVRVVKIKIQRGVISRSITNISP